METPSNATSQEELSRLREEGRITETEYENLRAAMQTPATTESQPDSCREPQFRVSRQGALTYCLVVSLIGLPTGLVLHLPYVWILSIAGIVVAPIKLSRMKGSWLAALLARRTRR
jgi:hypothetical protein